MSEIKEGAWYWCLVCRDCREPMPMYEITPEYVHESDGTGLWDITCPYCRAEGRYAMADGVRLQAASDDPGTATTIH